MNLTLAFRHVLAFSVLSPLLCAGQTAQAQWSQYQGNAAHTGCVPETVSGSRLIAGWSKTFSVNGQVARHSDIAVNAQGVYLNYQASSDYGDGSRYNVVSLNPATGQEQWSASVDSYAGEVSAPSLGSGLLYVHAYGHSGISGGNPSQYPHLVGINAATGQSVFSTAHEGQWDAGSRPTTLGNQVVALGGYYGGMDSHNAATGARQWRIGMPQQYAFIPAMDTQRAYIYYGSGSASPGPRISALYAINRATGNIDAIIQNPSDPSTTFSSISSVTLGGANDALVTANSPNFSSRQVTAFNLLNHSIKWSRDLNVTSSPAVAGGIVAVALQNSLEMLNEANGADLWTWNAPNGVSLSSNVVLTDNLAFVASGDTVFGVDRLTGTLDWSDYVGVEGNINGNQPYSLAYYGGTLYASGSTRLITFDAVPEPTGILLGGGLFAFGGGLLARRRFQRR